MAIQIPAAIKRILRREGFRFVVSYPRDGYSTYALDEHVGIDVSDDGRWTILYEEHRQSGRGARELARVLPQYSARERGAKRNPRPPRGARHFGEVIEIRYKHTGDGKNYYHDFNGARMAAEPDGSIHIYHPTRRLWTDVK